MPYSKAQMKASNKYRAKAYDRFEMTVPKGKRDEYRAQAASRGLSLNAYIISLLEADKLRLEVQTPEPSSPMPAGIKAPLIASGDHVASQYNPSTGD